MTRRELIQLLGASAAGLLIGCSNKNKSDSSSNSNKNTPNSNGAMQRKADKYPDYKNLVSVASNKTPAELVEMALKPLGGIETFVKKGSFVVIKPNAAWAGKPSVGCNTNPEVVGALIMLCKKAGASRVLAVEHTCDGPPDMVFRLSGIAEAVKQNGGELVAANADGLYQTLELPHGKKLKQVKVIKDIMNADCWINVPVAKHHGGAKMTISMKNLMGAVYDRSYWHSNDLSQCIADCSTGLQPDLILIDATRVMISGGPKGPGESIEPKTVIAAVDPVAADSYALTLFPEKMPRPKYVQIAEEMGVGIADLSKLKIVKV